MVTDQDTRHRVSIDVSGEMYERLQKHVPWGVMKPLVTTMLEDFLHLCEKRDSRLIIGAILSRDISLKDFLNKYDKDG